MEARAVWKARKADGDAVGLSLSWLIVISFSIWRARTRHCSLWTMAKDQTGSEYRDARVNTAGVHPVAETRS
jgi:hypothetical protein